MNLISLAGIPDRSLIQRDLVILGNHMITAEEIARRLRISAKRLRAELRKAELSWHIRYARWEAEVGTGRHRDMERIAATLK